MNYGDGPTPPIVDRGDLVPAKYNKVTELTLDVPAGEMQHNFELTSQ